MFVRINKSFSAFSAARRDRRSVYQTSPTEETSETTAGVLRIYHHAIVTSQSLQHDFY